MILELGSIQLDVFTDKHDPYMTINEHVQVRIHMCDVCNLSNGCDLYESHACDRT